MARSPAAAARLEAVAAAKQVHRDLDLSRRVTEGAGLVDVFEAIGELDIPLGSVPIALVTAALILMFVVNVVVRECSPRFSGVRRIGLHRGGRGGARRRLIRL